MFLTWVHVLIGLVVGILVGLTGVGGGVILLPILIFGLKVPPLIAVGSDAAFNAFTKIGAGFFHWRAGNVSKRLAAYLACGSLPGALIGVLILNELRAAWGSEINSFLVRFIGALLVCIPFLLLFQGRIERFFNLQRRPPRQIIPKLVGIGLLAGILVGMSSVGSGSIVIVLLLLFVQRPVVALVGTDVVHAIALTGFTGLLQLNFGNVDPWLVAALLVGSVPGSLIGVRISNRLPSPWLKRTLCALLLLTGIRMLGI